MTTILIALLVGFALTQIAVLLVLALGSLGGAIAAVLHFVLYPDLAAVRHDHPVFATPRRIPSS